MLLGLNFKNLANRVRVSQSFMFEFFFKNRHNHASETKQNSEIKKRSSTCLRSRYIRLR
jgi:hypothetical protein